MRERRSKSGDATTTKRGRTAHCSDRRRSSTQTAAEDWHNRWTETGGRSEEARKLFRLCSQDQWQYERAKRELSHSDWKKETIEILYRPFDVRWTVFDRNVAVHRRERVMRHML